MHSDPTDRIAELLVHIGRVSRREDAGSDLTAAQWTCLRFVSRANRNTRTPSGFANFQATTRGTASQIIKSLESRGLIAGRTSDTDRRSIRLDLTDAGRTMLENDPLGQLIKVLKRIDEADLEGFLDTLTRITASLAQEREVPTFGACLDCSHFSPGGEGGYCACLAAELDEEDIDKLCGAYEGPVPATAADQAPHDRS